MDPWVRHALAFDFRVAFKRAHCKISADPLIAALPPEYAPNGDEEISADHVWLSLTTALHVPAMLCCYCDQMILGTEGSALWLDHYYG